MSKPSPPRLRTKSDKSSSTRKVKKKWGGEKAKNKQKQKRFGPKRFPVSSHTRFFRSCTHKGEKMSTKRPPSRSSYWMRSQIVARREQCSTHAGMGPIQALAPNDKQETGRNIQQMLERIESLLPGDHDWSTERH